MPSQAALNRVEAQKLLTPAGFARGVLGHDTWSQQNKIMESVRLNRRTAVKSCNSGGKTFAAAALVLWWISTYPDGIAVTTSSSWTQLKEVLWGEIRKAAGSSRVAYPHVNLLDIKIAEGNYALGLSTNDASRFSGFHGMHVLLVIDEAQGVRQQVWEAITGLRAGGMVHMLAIGNPIVIGGTYYDAFKSQRSGWSTFTINAFDTPNLWHTSLTFPSEDGAQIVVGDGRDLMSLTEEELDVNKRPYLCTRRWVKEMYEEWGAQHPYFQARVLGAFPEQGDDTLIPLVWLERARQREEEGGGKPDLAAYRPRAGLDVAGPGEACTVLKVRIGPKIVFSKSWAKADPRGEVVEALTPFYKDGLETLNVDCVGIGWGMYLHLKDKFRPTSVSSSEIVQAINVGEAAQDTEKFANAKAEYYWGLRLRAQAGELQGLDEKTMGQLTAIRYEHNARGQIVIEGKDEMRKRGIKSPDEAEATMLAFAESKSALKLFPIGSVTRSGLESGEESDSEKSISLTRQSPWRIG